MAEKIGYWKRTGVTWLSVMATLWVIVVGVATGFMSWGHIVSVGESVNEPGAAVLPVAIDGMMLAATGMAAVDKMHGMKTRVWAIIGLWSGALLTLAFNLLSAVERGAAAMLIAVLFAATFIVSIEMVFHPSQRPLKAIKVLSDKVKNSSQPEPVVAEPRPVATQQPTQIERAPKQFPRSDRQKDGYQRREQRPPRNRDGGQRPAPTSKPMQVTVTTSEKEPVSPPAMEESLKDLVGSAAPIDTLSDQSVKVDA